MRKFLVAFDGDQMTIQAQTVDFRKNWVVFANDIGGNLPWFIVAAFPHRIVIEVTEIQ